MSSALRASAVMLRDHDVAEAGLSGIPATDFCRFRTEAGSIAENDKQKVSKGKLREFEVKLNPEDDNSGTHKLRIIAFSNGAEEGWCRTRLAVKELAKKMGASNLNDGNERAERRHAHCSAVLDGKALSRRNEAWAKHASRTPSSRSRWALNDVASDVFQCAKTACETQRKHLAKAGLQMGSNRPSEFGRRLEVMNSHLPLIVAQVQPNNQLAANNKLNEDHPIKTLDDARSLKMQNAMVANRDNHAKHDSCDACVKGLDEWHAASELADTSKKKVRRRQRRSGRI